MIGSKIFCLMNVLLIFFGTQVAAGLKLGSFINQTDKPVDLAISRLRENIKAFPGNMPVIKIRVAKGSSVKLDQFSFETIEGPTSGFVINYYLLGQKKPSKHDITIKYRYLVVDEKNCSKCGLCPSGYMASVYLESKLYKNVYSPIFQKGHGILDIILNSSGVQLGGNVQILDKENGLVLSNSANIYSTKRPVSSILSY